MNTRKLVTAASAISRVFVFVMSPAKTNSWRINKFFPFHRLVEYFSCNTFSLMLHKYRSLFTLPGRVQKPI
jgi:hypothetical protein